MSILAKIICLFSEHTSISNQDKFSLQYFLSVLKVTLNHILSNSVKEISSSLPDTKNLFVMHVLHLYADNTNKRDIEIQ